MKKSILATILFCFGGVAYGQCKFAKQSEIDVTCKTLQSLLRQHIRNDEKQQIWVILKTYQDINTICNVPDSVKVYVNSFMRTNKILYEQIEVNRLVAQVQTGIRNFRSGKPEMVNIENSRTTQ